MRLKFLAHSWAIFVHGSTVVSARREQLVCHEYDSREPDRREVPAITLAEAGSRFIDPQVGRKPELA